MTTSIGLNYILQIRNIRKQLQDVWCCRVCLNIFCRCRRIFARLLWMIFDVLIQREIMDIIKVIHAWEKGLQYSWMRNEYRQMLRCYYHLSYYSYIFLVSFQKWYLHDKIVFSLDLSSLHQQNSIIIVNSSIRRFQCQRKL